jgi:hypothetical protein
VFLAMSEEWAQEIERETSRVDVCDKERLVVFLVCKDVLMIRRKEERKEEKEDRSAWIIVHASM